jgi:oligosaccharide repeat unit polymerase
MAMYRYGRSVLFPPASLGIVWTITLFAVWLCGDLYFPLTTRANEIVLAGVLAFSLGGICAVVAPLREGQTMTAVSARRHTQVDRWLTIAGVLLLLNIPFSYLYFKQLSETIPPRTSMWRQIRIASNKANISGHNALSLESFILPLLSIIALIAVYEYADTGRRRARTLFLVLLAGGYQLLNGARSEVLLLLISSVVMLWLKKGVAPVRLLGMMGLMFLLVFSAGQVAMNKYGASAGASLTENLPRVAEGFGTYWLGGIIAFDQNRQNPKLRYGWDLGKFAKRIANRFGATYSESDRNLEYTKISPSQITNVYTAFLPYYMDHGGMFGVSWLMFLVGFLSAYVYRCAIRGKCWAVFTLGAFVYATVMTVFSEEYFAQIMFWVKAGTVPTIVYFTPSITLRGHARLMDRDVPGSSLCE